MRSRLSVSVPAIPRRLSPRSAVFFAVLALALEGGCRRPPAAEGGAPEPEGSTDASAEPQGEDAATHPPGPPVSADLPRELAEALPKTDGGLPILFAVQGGGANPGLSVRFVYDSKRDDAISRWGQCLSRLTACYSANPRAPIGGCIELIERCADDQGGKGCCPDACVASFRALRAKGIGQEEAVEQSFLEGGCVRGLREQLDAAGARR